MSPIAWIAQAKGWYTAWLGRIERTLNPHMFSTYLTTIPPPIYGRALQLPLHGQAIGKELWRWLCGGPVPLVGQQTFQTPEQQ